MNRIDTILCAGALVVLSLALGCSDVTEPPFDGDRPGGKADDGADPDLASEMEQAREAAARLRPYLDTLAADAVELAGGPEVVDVDDASGKAAFVTVFGPRLPVRKEETIFLYGERFAMDGAIWDGPFPVNFRTTEGRPIILLWGLGSSSQLFFYQPTIVDPRTGAIYQGLLPAGTGLVPDTADAGLDLYGPHEPPPEALVAGDFTDDEIAELTALLD